jgi:hypothetical protein
VAVWAGVGEALGLTETPGAFDGITVDSVPVEGADVWSPSRISVGPAVGLPRATPPDELGEGDAAEPVQAVRARQTSPASATPNLESDRPRVNRDDIVAPLDLRLFERGEVR